MQVQYHTKFNIYFFTDKGLILIVSCFRLSELDNMGEFTVF